MSGSLRTRVAWFGLLAACSASGGAPASPSPRTWHVASSALLDPEGRAVILRGVNLAGAHKTKPYFGFQQPADYARVRADWGMNAVRFLVTWAAIEPTEGAYDDAYLNELDRRIGWAEDAGLLVVVDMHQDLYGEGFPGGDGAPLWTCPASYYAGFKPTRPWFFGYLDPNLQHCADAFYSDSALQDHLVEAWRRVAQRLVHHANIVGFDALNEPFWGSYSITSYEADEVVPLYEKIVPAVRSAAADWVAFLEPGGSRNLGIATRLTPFSFPNVVYAPHSYDRDAESGMGFDPAHRDAVVSYVATLASEARALGAALWIGEYGGVPSHPGIVEYMTAQYDAAGAVGAGAMVWSYDESNGYGLLAPDGTEKSALVSTIVRPYPERVAGSLASYAFDAATRTLSFAVTIDPRITAPTVVSLPPRVYPSGVAVDCGGCTVTASPGSVALTSLPSGALTVTVRPR